jgi:hypothetical protein
MDASRLCPSEMYGVAVLSTARSLTNLLESKRPLMIEFAGLGEFDAIPPGCAAALSCDY